MRYHNADTYTYTRLSRQFTACLITFAVAAGLLIGAATAAPRSDQGDQPENPPAQTNPIVSIRIADPAAAESAQDPATLTIGRTGSTAAPLDVVYTAFGSATADEDYIALPGKVTIPAGASSATFSVEPLDDTKKEGAEMVVISLDNAPEYTIAAPTSATVWIADDDTAGQTVSFYIGDPNAAEPGPNTGDFTIARNGSTTTSLTVFYTIGGTATPGVDYVALPDNVTIPAGKASITVKVTPINDVTVEATEIVVLSFSPNASYSISTPASATVAIADNDNVPAGAPEYRIVLPVLLRGN